MHMNQFLAALSRIFLNKRTPGSSECITVGCSYEAPQGQDLCHACLTNILLKDISTVLGGIAANPSPQAIKNVNAAKKEPDKIIKKPAISRKLVPSGRDFVPSVSINEIDSNNIEAETNKDGRDLNEIAKHLPK